MIPADCILITTDDALGQAYISTETLDGERNLKPKLAPKITQGQLESLTKSRKVSLSYIDPNKDIYKYNGQLKCGKELNELTLKQFIPRGATLKNSQ